jgi:hypothetical protein
LNRADLAEGRAHRRLQDRRLSRRVGPPHILAAAPKVVGESWKLVKGKSGQPVDALIALAMALVVLTSEKKQRSLYVF